MRQPKIMDICISCGRLVEEEDLIADVCSECRAYRDYKEEDENHPETPKDRGLI